MIAALSPLQDFSLTTVVLSVLGIIALVTGVYLISENRRPQATLAWLLVFIFAPVVGVVAYVLFGRSTKAFSKPNKLRRQVLQPAALPLLSTVLARQDSEIARLESKSVAHKKLLLLVRRNSHSALTTRNRVELQQDAAEFYPHLIRDMEAARHSIHHQYFIWGSDEFTSELKDVLIAKARQGVEVRLLYDPIGSQQTRQAYLDELRAAGISVAPTSPLYRLHTISYRNHRKISVIDGAIAYTGGMNIGREQLAGGEGFSSWRDTQLRIEGDAVALFQAVFMVDWHNAVGENLFAPIYFPPQTLEPEAGDVPVQILPSGPDSRWAAIRQLYANMIINAERQVFVQSPYFILDASLAEALRSAAMSGVDVRVMVSARPSGNRLPAWAGNTYFGDVIDAGVRIFLYEKGYLHAKTLSIDSKICSIGSANIDIRSFSINYELNAVVYSERVARELEEDFARDLRHCVEFDPAEYAKQNIALRFRDSLTRLVSPLL